MKLVTRLFIITLLFVSSSPAFALMKIDRSIIHFDAGGRQQQDLKIDNPDNKTLYVKLELIKVTNPGTPQEKQTTILKPEEVKMLVTPNRLIIPPRGTKSVRFVNLKPPGEKESIFRVSVIPVEGKEFTEENVSGVKVLVGYQILILIQPKEPQANVQGTFKDNQLTLTNLGNINVMMRRGTQCKDRKRKKNCYTIPDFRLYPGNSRVIDLQYSMPITFDMAVGESNKPVNFQEKKKKKRKE